MIEIVLPLPYYKPVGKALMTMNVYRNAHHFTLSKFKREYAEKCREALDVVDKLKLTNTIVKYELHTKPTKGGKPKKLDMVNVLSVVDKVFMDVLVTDGWLEDDSIEFISYVKFTSINRSSEDCIKVRIINE